LLLLRKILRYVYENSGASSNAARVLTGFLLKMLPSVFDNNASNVFFLSLGQKNFNCQVHPVFGRGSLRLRRIEDLPGLMVVLSSSSGRYVERRSDSTTLMWQQSVMRMNRSGKPKCFSPRKKADVLEKDEKKGYQ
jgi:hypothetical protein